MIQAGTPLAPSLFSVFAGSLLVELVTAVPMQPLSLGVRYNKCLRLFCHDCAVSGDIEGPCTGLPAPVLYTLLPQHRSTKFPITQPQPRPAPIAPPQHTLHPMDISRADRVQDVTSPKRPEWGFWELSTRRWEPRPLCTLPQPRNKKQGNLLEMHLPAAHPSPSAAFTDLKEK